MAEESNAVEVSCRIEAPAALIFKILANPQRHVDFDGSDMLRGAILDHLISEVGDTFTMKMHRLGDDYLMVNYVVEFEPDRRIQPEGEGSKHGVSLFVVAEVLLFCIRTMSGQTR